MSDTLRNVFIRARKANESSPEMPYSELFNGIPVHVLFNIFQVRLPVRHLYALRLQVELYMKTEFIDHRVTQNLSFMVPCLRRS